MTSYINDICQVQNNLGKTILLIEVSMLGGILYELSVFYFQETFKCISQSANSSIEIRRHDKVTMPPIKILDLALNTIKQ